MNMSSGEDMVGWLEQGRLVLESRQALLEQVQARYADVEGSLADELIYERRLEAARE